VLVNRTRGILNLPNMKVRCLCPACAANPNPEAAIFTPTQFEQHGGAGSAKKWKASLRLEPGGVPECPANSNPMQVGRWLEMKGIETKTAGGKPAGERGGGVQGFLWWGLGFRV
jgi:hypothetical protein